MVDETRETIDLDRQSVPPARQGGMRDAARDASRRDTVAIPVPMLGRVYLSRPQLAYVGGLALLTALEIVPLPVGLALAAGHLLAADRDSQTLDQLGEALEQA